MFPASLPEQKNEPADKAILERVRDYFAQWGDTIVKCAGVSRPSSTSIRR